MAEKPEKPESKAKPEKGGKPEGADAPKGKDAKGGKGEKEKKEAPKEKGFRSDNPNFKYIVRIANSDLKGEHPIEIALAAVRGIGIRTAGVIADMTGVNRAERIGNLDDAQVQKLEDAVSRLAETVPPWLVNRNKDLESGNTLHVVATDVEIKLRDDINRMKKIRTYKGVRHENGQKVRGQRSRSNGRTGLTMGVQRKDVVQKAAGGKEEGGAKEEKKEAKPAAGGAKPAAPAGGAKPAAGGAAKPAGGKPAEKK